MADRKTLAVYDEKAADYAALFQPSGLSRSLRDFLAAIPAGGRILDLGCGPATASAQMRAAGFDPDPVDASPQMVLLANARYAIGARLGTFDDIGGLSIYDGVWANFSLLHARRADLPRHLGALVAALKPEGVLHIGMKTGTGEARDGLGRFYTYVTPTELTALLTDQGLKVLWIEEGREVGLAGTEDGFVLMRAEKPHHG